MEGTPDWIREQTAEEHGDYGLDLRRRKRTGLGCVRGFVNHGVEHRPTASVFKLRRMQQAWLLYDISTELYPFGPDVRRSAFSSSCVRTAGAKDGHSGQTGMRRCDVLHDATP